ncbi:glutamate-1-semialdehyde 2,1-aminomutase [Verrucomicrobiota bacterium]
MKANKSSHKLWRHAQKLMPGGVNSPVRAFGAVGGNPVFADYGSGSHISDADSNDYIDYVMSWGALILGHANPKIVEAAKKAAEKGMTFGMPTKTENMLAERIIECAPGIEKIRMVSSGTEAAMSAIRLARGFTGKNLIVKCEGCYHGHSDGLLVSAGSGVATFSIPGTKGVPDSYAEKTIVVPYNDQKSMREVFENFGNEIACIIVEPIAANMGVIPPESGYLQFLREITSSNNALLIFDEVITGFRVGLSGAQGLYGVTPDLTVLGKIIGGGMPAAAYGGREGIMSMLAPSGPVYQAGTLSGNPVAMATGLATLELLINDSPYERLEALSKMLEDGFRDAANKAGVPIQMNRVGSLQTVFFSEKDPIDYASAKESDTNKYGKFFSGMLEKGIHLAPSQFEAAFVSLAHSEADIEKTINAAAEVMEAL